MSRGLFPMRDLTRALAERVFGPAKRQPSSSSPAVVGGDETIGSGRCWCGQEHNHDWPGKEIGAAHPRYPR